MNPENEPASGAPHAPHPGSPVTPPEPAGGHFESPPEPIVAANSSWWHRIGGGSLTVSIIVHAAVIILTIFIVRTVMAPPPEVIEFLPGGGGGGKGNDARISTQRRAAQMSAPKTRIVSTVASDSISLPDIQTSMSDFSSLSMAAPMGGGMGGGSGGISGKGSGGLRGDGFGSGVGPGRGAGFVSIPMIFGTKIDAKKMAVVLDMSGSMYPFLPTVIKEVDKVAPGSTIILHYGCGMSNAEIRNPKTEQTRDKSFMEDRIVTTLAESTILNGQAKKDLMDMITKRAKTFFVPSTTSATTWVALTDSELKDVDAIYWFADFADTLNNDRLEEVSRRLRARKQKLYIHPSNPQWLVGGDPLAVNVARVESAIVEPTGGKVIRADVKKEGDKKDVPVKDDKAKPADAKS